MGCETGLATGGKIGLGTGASVVGAVGAVGPEGTIFTSAQFQNCSGTPLPSGG